jgi:FkbM family methyltransferase
MANWPLVAVDKLGLARLCRYRTRSSLQVWCRARSTDVNEAVSILSGYEYPPELVRLRDGAVVLDVGANIGSFALLVADVNREIPFRGVAFEPFPPNFAMLLRNLAANELTEFTAVEAAVSDVDGRVWLSSPGAVDEVRIARTPGDFAEIEATSWRLSTYCTQAGIESVHLLKLDVEGSEYEIVRADIEFIEARVENLLIEYHELGSGRGVAALRKMLSARFALTMLHQRSETGVLHARNMSPRAPAR